MKKIHNMVLVGLLMKLKTKKSIKKNDLNLYMNDWVLGRIIKNN